jgi:hypothetical protein
LVFIFSRIIMAVGLLWHLTGMCIWRNSSCCRIYAVVTLTLPPSGSSKIEQQHILFSSRWTT